MITIETPADLADWVGKTIGPSDWVTVDQPMIDAFAHATGDLQWIHVDPERAARELPGGKTIAHGFLTLSLLPRLQQSMWKVQRASRGLNYGSNKVRFMAPVPSGARVRLLQKVVAVDPIPGGVKLTAECTFEIEGQSKPAMVAETIGMVFD